MLSRFALLTLFASSVLYATSFTSASCTLGNTTQTATGSTSSSCSIQAYVNGVNIGYVGGYGDVTGSLSPSDTLGVDAGGGFSVPGTFPDVGFSGSGTATYSQTFNTAGPLRPGFFLANFEGFGGTWSAYISQNGNQYDASGTLSPFELGEPFQVYLSASGGGGGSPGCDSNCGPGAGESTAGIGYFQLFEADGTTGVPYFSIVTPEPASWKFLLFGLAITGAFYVGLRKAGSGSPRG